MLLIVGILLDLIQFDAALSSQTTYTSIMLGVILCIGSLVAFLLAYMVLNKYDLTKEKVSEIQLNIKNRKKDLEQGVSKHDQTI